MPSISIDTIGRHRPSELLAALNLFKGKYEADE